MQENKVIVSLIKHEVLCMESLILKYALVELQSLEHDKWKQRNTLKTSAAMVVPVRTQVPDFPGQSIGWAHHLPASREAGGTRQAARQVSVVSSSSRVEFHISSPSCKNTTSSLPRGGFGRRKRTSSRAAVQEDGSSGCRFKMKGMV